MLRLRSFQYLPKGPDGWQSRLLTFGDTLTAVQGDNGSGKTPIMKGILQALGHEVDLPPELHQKCKAAELVIDSEQGLLRLKRELGQDFSLTVQEGSAEPRSFESIADYSRWFLTALGSDERVLTNKQNQATALYINVLLPALSVDQDHGWTNAYWVPPHRNFIQDQRQEVIRFLLGLPARHAFRSRQEFDDAKQELERIERSLELQRFILDRLRASGDLQTYIEGDLKARQSQLQAELGANSTAIEALRSLAGFYDSEISRLESRRDQLRTAVDGVTRKRGQLALVFGEIDGEVEILTANVQATDILRQFCARSDCQMLASSQQSYGRALLFLKDQVKDLRKSDRSLDADGKAFQTEIESLEKALEERRLQRQSAITDSPQAQIVQKLDALTNELVQVELKLARIQQLDAEQTKFERLLDRREQVASAVAAKKPHRGKGSIDTGLNDARQQLTESIQGWLAALATPNTRSARFDDDFELDVDGERFDLTSHQSGSTRLRIVLSFHAALLEVALSRGGNHPGWLMFDAPKQHELNQSDFDEYVNRLRLVAAKYPKRVQLVFSAADLKTQMEVGDEIWMPGFVSPEGPRYLGVT